MSKKTPTISPPLQPEPELEPRAISIYDLRANDCRFPLGRFQDKPPYRFCGLLKQEDSSYCPVHTRIVRGL